MNDYQIIQDVGRSKYSMVYKGRKKKSVQFFALKCVDKSQKPKIMREVKFLHRLHSPYSMQFYEWFETANHLWLILEFCPGNRLYDLLQADLKLPESSVRMFGLNLLGALQFLHNNGIVYGNLKPSAVIIDAAGILKLSDFSLAQYVNSVNPESEQGQTSKRGTPSYMAPELFHPHGVLSYQSDFWSLGCVMYEMASGRAPFLSSGFKALVTSILSDPYVVLPTLSEEFNDFVRGLLDKSAWKRPSWAEARASDLWEYSLPDAEMPPQPAFERFCAERIKEAAERDQGSTEKRDPLEESGVDVAGLSAAVEQNLTRSSIGKYRTNLGIDGATEVDVGPNVEIEFSLDAEGDAGVVEGGGGDECVEGGDEWGGEEAGGGAAATTIQPYQRPCVSPPPESDDDDNISDGVPGGGEDVAWRPISAPLKKGLGGGGVDAAAGRPFSAFASTMLSESSQGGGEYLDLSELLYCVADLQVRPIVLNKRIERIPASQFDPKACAFKTPADVADVEGLSARDLQDLIASAHRALSDKTPITDKLNVLAYMERLSSSSALADVLANSDLALMMVKMMRGTKSSPLRARVAHVLGLLIRHTSFLSTDLQQGGLLVALMEGIRERDANVRRRAMAALGELLYYIVSQSGGGAADDGVEGEGQEVWQMPANAGQVLVRGLRKEEDAVVQHYVCQTLDNLATQGSKHVVKMATYEIVSGLLGVVGFATAESLRGTAASAMCRLVRAVPSLAAQVCDKAGLATIVQKLNDDNARVQQAFLNLLNTALLEPSQRTVKALNDLESLLPPVLRLLEHSDVTVRAKCLVTLQLLFRLNNTFILSSCDKKVLPSLERLLREKDAYLSHCLQSLLAALNQLVPRMALSMSEELASIIKAKKPAPPGADLKPLKHPLSLLPVLLHMVTSPCARGAINGQVIKAIAAFLNGWDACAFQGVVEFRRLTLVLVEAISQQGHILVAYHEHVIADLLPALVQATVSEDAHTGGAQRFQCLHAIGDVLQTILSEKSIYDPAAQVGSGGAKVEHAAACTKLVHELLVRNLLPNFGSILSDKEPVPLHGVRILRTVMEHNPAFGIIIHRVGLVPKILSFLEPRGAHNSSHCAALVTLLVECNDLDLDELYLLGLARRIGDLVEYMVASHAEDFFEYVLNTFSALMYSTATLVQDAENLANEGDVVTIDAHLLRNEPLLRAAPALARMCVSSQGSEGEDALAGGDTGYYDMEICESASQCLLLLAHLYPLHVLSSMEAAGHVAEGLRRGNTSVQKRLLKAVLWVLNAGDADTVAPIAAEMEPAVAGIAMQRDDGAGGSTAVRELSQQVLQSVHMCMGIDSKMAKLGLGGEYDGEGEEYGGQELEGDRGDGEDTYSDDDFEEP